MNRRALTVSLLGAVALLSGIHAVAAPPLPTTSPISKQPSPPPQVNPATLPKLVPLDGPTYRLPDLKQVKTLSLADKIRIARPTGPAEERDVEAPITLSPRAPWHASGAGLNFFEPRMVRTDNDVVYTPKKSGPSGSFVALNFTAQPERRYLLDCRVIVVNDRVQITATTSGGSPIGIPTIHAQASVTPTDGHASLLIPKSSAPRNLFVTLNVEGDPNQSWGLWDCEITPIR